MHRRTFCTAAALTLLLSACQRPALTASAPDHSLPASCALGNAPAGTRILVYSKTSGYRHASIPAAAAAITSLGSAHGFAVEHTEDASVFTDASLARFAAVTFLMNTQKVLDSAQRAAFQRYALPPRDLEPPRRVVQLQDDARCRSARPRDRCRVDVHWRFDGRVSSARVVPRV